MYNSWKGRMELYIKGKENGRMILDSVLKGPLVYGTIEVECVTRTKTYEELSDKEKHQDDCDIRATNIVLQGLQPEVYSLVNHHTVAKEIWDRVKLLMQGTKLSQQERECKLYNEFDRFTSVKDESLHEYYLRFAKLINDIHTIGMTIQQVHVNTKFLNNLQPEWRKFVTNVKLAKNLYTSNYDHLYVYLSKHEVHANEVRLMRERFPNPLALFYSSQPHSQSYEVPHHQQQYQTPISHSTPSVPQHAYQALAISQQSQAEFPQLDSGLDVPSFLPGDDPITSLNKAMTFLSTSIASRYPTTNNQLRTSSNLRNQATIQDGRVLDEEQLAFLADPGVVEGQDTQTTMPHNAAFQTDDLDAFDSDCDEAPSARAVLMANLSSYDSYVISESDIEITCNSNIISYDQYLKETKSVVGQNTTSTEQQNAMIMSVIDEISSQVAKCNAESLVNKNVNESLTAELERYKERIKQFEDRKNVDLNDREKYLDSEMNDMIRNRNAKYDAFEKEIETLKFTLSKNVKENESLTTTIDVLKKQTKEKEDKYIEEIVDLEKKKKALDNIVYKVGQSVQTMHMLTKPQVFYDNTHKQSLGYQNPFYLKKAQRIKPTLYDGSVLSKKHDVMYVVDSEETLILAEESRSKMIEKNDLNSKEKNVNVYPIKYAELNKLSEHFGKHFFLKRNCLQNKLFGY
ncbi:hypothetical protein Tco_0345365 [Tanacetum coccineum]